MATLPVLALQLLLLPILPTMTLLLPMTMLLLFLLLATLLLPRMTPPLRVRLMLHHVGCRHWPAGRPDRKP